MPLSKGQDEPGVHGRSATIPFLDVALASPLHTRASPSRARGLSGAIVDGLR